MKHLFFSLIAICLLANNVTAQTVADLREQLERERLLTAIANERAKRDFFYYEQENKRFENRQREIYNRRNENDQITNARSQEIRNVNEFLNVITNGLRNIKILGSQR